MLVLVADDDALVALDIQSALEDAGHEVEICLDGLEALARLASMHPDVLITDLNMPGMRGDQLIAAVRRTGEPVAILLVTGDRIGADERFGADRCLHKPFVPSQLMATFSQLCAA